MSALRKGQPRLDTHVAGPVEDFRQRWMPVVAGELSRHCADLSTGNDGLDTALAKACGVGTRAGRRWRPLLALATAQACAPDRVERALDLAVGVELTHTASLVLDDLPCMDDADERRGIVATHRMVGPAGAILVAIGLLGRAAELLAADAAAGSHLAGVWGRTIGLKGMSGGQVMDLAATSTLRGEERRLHRRKTTDLVALATAGVARLMDRGAVVEDDLNAFGRHLGWSYQLADDAQDLSVDAMLGRPLPGRDLQARSRRHLHRGLDRLDRSNLTDEGKDLLTGLAHSVVHSFEPNAAHSDMEAWAC